MPDFLRKVIGSKKRPCCHKQHGHPDIVGRFLENQ
jgi:hypothetical protein